MAKPAIITVDDDVAVLNSIERDLRAHYGGEYRIVKAGSGSEALDAAHELKRRGDQVALFLVDQRMPQMTGTELLAEVRTIYPLARRALLTAYADTDVAIAGINEIELDLYLMKPWDPPEEHLYPMLDELLFDWHAEARPEYEGIRVAGTLWSSSSHRAKDFLHRNRIPYQWLDIEKDSAALAMVEAHGDRRLPVIFFPDGDVLVDPDLEGLAEKVGLQTHATQPVYDLIIVGGGPAGLGAAVYGSSEGLRTVMIEREATGGQAGTSSRIENYLGFPKGLSGADLAKRATDQALRFGTEIITTRTVTGLRVEDPYRVVELDDGSELSAKAIVIATGVDVRRLEVPGIDQLTGAGVYYGAALSEAPNFRGQPVFVVGGANSAGQGAMLFARYASQVTMLVRGSSLAGSMSQYLIDQIDGTENIDVWLRAEVTAVGGDQRLETITVINRDTEETSEAKAAALFIFIGAKPHTDFLEGVVERRTNGYLPTGQDLIVDGKRPRGWTLQRDPFYLETSVPGVFAAGDVRQGSMARVASAVGSGAMAVHLVHQYLKTV